MYFTCVVAAAVAAVDVVRDVLGVVDVAAAAAAVVVVAAAAVAVVAVTASFIVIVVVFVVVVVLGCSCSIIYLPYLMSGTGYMVSIGKLLKIDVVADASLNTCVHFTTRFPINFFRQIMAVTTTFCVAEPPVWWTSY